MKVAVAYRAKVYLVYTIPKELEDNVKSAIEKLNDEPEVLDGILDTIRVVEQDVRYGDHISTEIEP